MPSPTPNTGKVTLTDRLRFHSRGVLEPAADVLVRAGVSPDALTVAGLLAHLLVAGLVAAGWLPLAGLLLAVSAPLDALDGAVARRMGRLPGQFGAFLDSTADRVAEIILFGGLIFYFSRQGAEWLALVAYLALGASLMVSYTRARAEGIGVECKVGVLSRVERYIVLVIGLLLSRPDVAVAIVALGASVTVGQRVYHVWRATKANR